MAFSKLARSNGSKCGGSAEASAEVERAVEGMRSSTEVSANDDQPKGKSLLLAEMMKSRATTSISSGLMSSRSVVLYICGYLRCTAVSAASVHRACDGIKSDAPILHCLSTYSQICSAVAFRKLSELIQEFRSYRRLPLLGIDFDDLASCL